MIYHFLAELILVLHFFFVLFVVLGGLLSLRWPWVLLAARFCMVVGHPGTVLLLDLPAHANRELVSAARRPVRILGRFCRPLHIVSLVCECQPPISSPHSDCCSLL